MYITFILLTYSETRKLLQIFSIVNLMNIMKTDICVGTFKIII